MLNYRRVNKKRDQLPVEGRHKPTSWETFMKYQSECDLQKRQKFHQSAVFFFHGESGPQSGPAAQGASKDKVCKMPSILFGCLKKKTRLLHSYFGIIWDHSIFEQC